jgi:hypothetical protein
MTNILELINASESAEQVTVTFNDINGTTQDTVTFTAQPGSQTDIIINDLNGFQESSYGVVIITGNITGRVFFYRTAEGTNPFDPEYEYAFGVPLLEGITGTSAAGFNTFQPSYDPADANNPVFNWFSVVNLEETSQSYTVQKFDINGNLLSQQPLTLAPSARSDIEGGHILPGPSNVGMMKVIPNNGSAKYIAQIVRYGLNRFGNGFEFAFPLVARNGNTETFYVQYGASYPGQTWLELVNTSNTPSSAVVKYIRDGIVSQFNVNVGANSQQHFDIASVAGTGFGIIEVSGFTNGSLIAQTMRYITSKLTSPLIEPPGRVRTVYGIQEQLQNPATIQTSYNLFLEMTNLLSIDNITASPLPVIIRVQNVGETEFTDTEVTVNPFDCFEVFLEPTLGRFGEKGNSYGTVKIFSPSSGAIFGYLLRYKMAANSSSSNELDFIAPTVAK